MKEYLQTTDAVLDKVGSSGTGLTGAEAAARLEKNGKNKLAEGKRESVILRFLKQLVEPMTIILLVAAAISAVLAVYEGSFPSDVVIIMQSSSSMPCWVWYRNPKRRRRSPPCRKCPPQPQRYCATESRCPYTVKILSSAMSSFWKRAMQFPPTHVSWSAPA